MIRAARGAILCLALVQTGAWAPGVVRAQEPDRERVERVRSLLEALAADSLMGRMTATPGARAAAAIIASELESYGVAPGGDRGFLQAVSMVRTSDGRRPMALWSPGQGEPVTDYNVVGVVRGSELPDQGVVVGAHYDHVGVGPPVDGDSIYNGADDDASGVVAVLEAARALAAGPPPRRTVVFVFSTGEESGLLGTRWHVENPVVPLSRTVANLQVEMVGRPDSLIPPGSAWLTGFERSTMGATLRTRGLPVVPDPRPSERFFVRSDNIAYARRGVPAHTLSSFGLHDDYHRPSDEAERVDFQHLARMAELTSRAVRILADGPAPEWNPGGRPEPRRRARGGP